MQAAGIECHQHMLTPSYRDMECTPHIAVYKPTLPVSNMAALKREMAASEFSRALLIAPKVTVVTRGTVSFVVLHARREDGIGGGSLESRTHFVELQDLGAAVPDNCPLKAFERHAVGATNTWVATNAPAGRHVLGTDSPGKSGGYFGLCSSWKPEDPALTIPVVRTENELPLCHVRFGRNEFAASAVITECVRVLALAKPAEKVAMFVNPNGQVSLYAANVKNAAQTCVDAFRKLRGCYVSFERKTMSSTPEEKKAPKGCVPVVFSRLDRQPMKADECNAVIAYVSDTQKIKRVDKPPVFGMLACTFFVEADAVHLIPTTAFRWVFDYEPRVATTNTTQHHTAPPPRAAAAASSGDAAAPARSS
jgi:hypothetical protein